MDIKEAEDKFLVDLATKRSKNTVSTYRISINTFNRFLDTIKLSKDHNVSEITNKVIFQYPGWAVQQSDKKATIHIYIAGISSFVRYLIINDLIQFEFIDEMKLETIIRDVMLGKESNLPKIPAPGDVEKMLIAVDSMEEDETIPEKLGEIILHRNKALIHFFATSACRIQEVMNLCCKDIKIEEQYGIVKGKGKKTRLIYFDKECAEHLKIYWEKRGWSDPNDPVFGAHHANKWRRQKMSIPSIHSLFKELKELSGVTNFTPHTFRHGAATKLLKKTHDIRMVQEYLGHANITTTQRYTHIDHTNLRKELKELYE